MYKCTVLADSLGLNQTRLTTFKITFPRIILAEFNTHRVFSRNSASSRAIPTRKLIKQLLDQPFTPVAWQKDHPGMQGTQYFEPDEKLSVFELTEYMKKRLLNMFRATSQTDDEVQVDDRVMEMYNNIFKEFTFKKYTLDEFWLMTRDKVLESAVLLTCLGATKQVVNRILEPFMYHEVIVTSTTWDNFFKLRCPQYNINGDIFKTKKEALKKYPGDIKYDKPLDWWYINQSAAEIHIQVIAEMMYDAFNESKPKQLKPGEWHIPFGDKLDIKLLHDYGIVQLDNYYEIEELILAVATARCARISYETLGDNPQVNYEEDIKLHNMLLQMEHMSPFEHCGKCQSLDEFGPSRNFTGGFTQYRELAEKQYWSK